ncbi:phage terminase small subunit P27 family [Salininema proteolyticum]|uniref:Phage terminase small subunit P27 family n=1 Tax=Salininema proteolyticum TaxID=1607685 RepID=A0ABV8TTL5_9ACTN
MTVAGKGGRPKKPTGLKMLHGDRADRVNTSEPQPDSSEVTRPAWLTGDAAGVWDRLAPDLIRKGVLTAWDVDLFATFCSAVIVNRDALVEIDENGVKCSAPVRELSDGTIVYDLRRNPAWQVARESATMMATVGGRFGLSPADRAGLSIGEADDGDSTADLLSG